MCLSYPATRGVTSITEYRTGVAQDLTLWRWDGQLLKRRDGYRQWRSLLVTYDIGYYDATAPSPVAPAWARSMALHIGQQWLKTVGKFRSASGTDPVGFLVPFPALEAGRDYMLVPRIG